MENIINVNALREALASGMSSATIHDWVDDTIVAMGYFNQYYGNNYVAVSKENLQPGDIVMFNYRGYYGIGHVGIYIGDGKMIHAENSSTGVIISDIFSGYYGARYVGARRIV